MLVGNWKDTTHHSYTDGTFILSQLPSDLTGDQSVLTKFGRTSDTERERGPLRGTTDKREAKAESRLSPRPAIAVAR